MKKHFLYTFVSAILLLAYSCADDIRASGEVITQEINTESFSGISVSLPADIYIVQDGIERLEIETHENLFNVIRTEVNDGVLRIYSDENIRNVNTMNIYVQVDDLDKLKLAGSGNVFIYDCLISAELDTELSGSGTINLCGRIDDLSAKLSGSGTININSVTANSVHTETTGSGRVNASGTTSTATFKITGSGDVRGFNLNAANAIIDVSGSGDIETSVSGALTVNISGSGDVRYKGSPQVNSNVTGSGSVRKVD